MWFQAASTSLLGGCLQIECGSTSNRDPLTCLITLENWTLSRKGAIEDIRKALRQILRAYIGKDWNHDSAALCLLVVLCTPKQKV